MFQATRRRHSECRLASVSLSAPPSSRVDSQGAAGRSPWAGAWAGSSHSSMGAAPFHVTPTRRRWYSRRTHHMHRHCGEKSILMFTLNRLPTMKQNWGTNLWSYPFHTRCAFLFFRCDKYIFVCYQKTCCKPSGYKQRLKVCHYAHFPTTIYIELILITQHECYFYIAGSST